MCTYKVYFAHIMILFLFIFATANAQIHYVDDNAPNDPGPNDPSVSDPDEDGSPEHPFDEIQEAINSAIDGDTIIVEEGTYYENIHFYGKNITLTGTDPNDWGVVENTIIDGQEIDSVVIFAGTESLNSSIKGITIQNGKPADSWQTGGGITGHGTMATVSKCVIKNNETPSYGGGILNCDGKIYGCKITDNHQTEDTGGGGGLSHCDGLIQNCIIYNNTCFDEGAGVYQCNGVIDECIIINNRGIYTESDGGGLAKCNGTISNCIICDNSDVWWGGGLFDCDGIIINCYISNNFTWGSGAGLCGCDGEITQCIISKNINNGGYFENGGGVSSCNANFTNCTIVFNEALAMSPWPGGYGSGLYNCTGTVRNSIIWGNYGQVDPEQIYGGSLVIEYSDIEYSHPGTGNIALNPLFADPNNGDFHLLAGSSCIDAGDNSGVTELTDPDGRPRILDGDNNGTPVVDMGAYEYGPVVMYVDDNASGDPGPNDKFLSDPDEDGSPEHPFDEIQEAINIAIDSDTIIVLDGTYWENITITGKDITLTTSDPNETYELANTIINGQQLSSAMTIIDSDSTIEGFTITNGLAEKGGGMYNSNSSPTVTNCLFMSNVATSFHYENVCCGGGMYNSNSSPNVTNCSFINNVATPFDPSWRCAYGGGMFNSNSSPNVTNCIFNGNIAVEAAGGGMFNSNSSPTVKYCRFSGNRANAYFAPVGGSGGGIGNFFGNPTVTDCIFIGNVAEHSYSPGSGGGIYGGSAINCIFLNNEAGYGGGMYGGSAGTCIFYENASESWNYECYGGGMYGGSAANCIFYANSTESHREESKGGGMYGGSAINCTFYENSAVCYYYYESEGGGIYNTTVKNCILWNNTAQANPQVSSSSIPQYSCIQDWTENGTNINSDPLFADPNNGDFHLQSQAGRWDPNQMAWVYDDTTSPCIDAGDPNSDWTGELWPNGRRINMGAYGGTPQASKSPSMAGNIADLSLDNCVGLEDLMLFVDKWLVQDVLLAADMDLNNHVDLIDFSILSENWLFCGGQDLVGDWQFNETQGDQAHDSSIYGNHGTLVNGPVWTGTGELQFDGLNDYVEVPDSDSLTFTNQITISLWMKLTENNDRFMKILIQPSFVTSTEPWENYCIDLRKKNPRFSISAGIPGTWYGCFDTSYNSPLQVGVWYHLAGTYDGTTMTLYVNGQPTQSQPVSLVIGNNDLPVCIGGRWNADGFPGLIDEVRIYNRALDAADIQSLYQSH